MSSSVALISWYMVPGSGILLLHALGTHLRWLLFHRPPAVLPTLMRLRSCIVWCCRRQLVASPLSALISIPLDLGRMAVSFGLLLPSAKAPDFRGNLSCGRRERLLQSDPRRWRGGFSLNYRVCGVFVTAASSEGSGSCIPLCLVVSALCPDLWSADTLICCVDQEGLQAFRPRV